MIVYDKYGKMKYNSEFHGKHGTSWSYEDLKYLIDWYDVAGAEEMSFALERTPYTIALKVCELRKKGIMKKERKIYFKSTRHKG